ncbi:alanine:cation symporter family protein [Kroppenstedtia eburnea]|uniref:alanine:cation symporter family protein n=1 Tax=Kroppenstedtia eburnea TaxID=714067 RepID=UPI003641C6BB
MNRTKSSLYYRIFFVLVLFVGAMQEIKLVWDLSDTMNALMPCPTRFASCSCPACSSPRPRTSGKSCCKNGPKKQSRPGDPE